MFLRCKVECTVMCSGKAVESTRHGSEMLCYGLTSGLHLVQLVVQLAASGHGQQFPSETSKWRRSKTHGPEGRTGPAGNGSYCLTLLSEPTRKLAVFQPPTRLTNGALATAKQRRPEGWTEPAAAKQQGPEGRTGPAGNGSYCLTLLSEPTRKLAVFQPATRPRTRRLRQSEAAGPWRTDRACGQRLLLPNVAFWTYKKTSYLPAGNKAQKTAPSPQRNSRALKDGPGLRATALTA